MTPVNNSSSRRRLGITPQAKKTTGKYYWKDLQDNTREVVAFLIFHGSYVTLMRLLTLLDSGFYDI